MALKKTFQSALTNSPAYKPLFNKELETKIGSLKDLAQRAEDQFWAMAGSEFKATGVINVPAHNARTASGAICAGAVMVMNDILSVMATVLGVSHTALVWATEGANPADYAKRSLYAPAVADACDNIQAEVQKLREILESTFDLAAASNVLTSFSKLYDVSAAAFKNFGPNFPTVLTAFYSAKDATSYTLPTIGAKLDTNNLLLYNYYKEGASKDFDGHASDAFHHLIAADSILIEAMEIEGFEQFVGMPGLTLVNPVDLDPLTITSGSNSLGANTPIIVSEPATTFGEIFRIRKIKAA